LLTQKQQRINTAPMPVCGASYHPERRPRAPAAIFAPSCRPFHLAFFGRPEMPASTGKGDSRWSSSSLPAAVMCGDLAVFLAPAGHMSDRRTGSERWAVQVSTGASRRGVRGGGRRFFAEAHWPWLAAHCPSTLRAVALELCSRGSFQARSLLSVNSIVMPAPGPEVGGP
jgi:hypothetical protein